MQEIYQYPLHDRLSPPGAYLQFHFLGRGLIQNCELLRNGGLLFLQTRSSKKLSAPKSRRSTYCPRHVRPKGTQNDSKINKYRIWPGGLFEMGDYLYKLGWGGGLFDFRYIYIYI